MSTISSPGIGSQLDVNTIVSQLMKLESQPLTNLQTKEASYQAKLSAYGSLKGALSSFQNAVSALSSATQFQSLTAASSNSSVLTASAINTAAPDSNSINVSALAQAQTLSAAGQTSTTDAVGNGTATTLTFQFGTIGGGTLSDGQYTGAAFTPDTAQASGTVTIDSSNNSLQGIRDAINAANLGVTAKIVNDGDPSNPYRLLITSNSTGAAKSMKITSNGGDADVTSLLSYDPAGTQNMSQTTSAQNASLTVNGLAITSASNTVTGAIPGVTLNLAQTGSTTLTVANDTSSVASAVQSFIQAYNSANTTIDSLTSYNADTKAAGLLLGDYSAQSIQMQLRNTLSNSLAGLGSSTLTNLTQIGISFEKDGSLSLDNSKLQSALTSNFGDFAALFASVGKSSDSLTSYLGSTGSTKPGSYAVSVTRTASQGNAVGSDSTTQAALTGSASAGLTITAGSNDTITLSIDGGAAVTATLTAGTYTADTLAAEVQSQINAALTSASQAGQVKVTQDSGVLSIHSDKFGAASGVSSVTGNGVTGLLGASPISASIATIAAGVNDQLTLSVNGTSATVTLAPGQYDADALATQIQSAVNASADFSVLGITVKVTQSNGVLTMTSDKYGSSSTVSITGGNAMSDLFGAAPTSTGGVDVAGTINGVAATGSGQVLTGATGDASDGLRVQITGGSTGNRGTVSFSNGYAYNLNTMLNSILSSNGPIASSTDSINRTIADIGKQEEALSTRLTAVQARYLAQFTALDTLIGQMNTTSTFLTQQLANLPSASSDS